MVKFTIQILYCIWGHSEHKYCRKHFRIMTSVFQMLFYHYWGLQKCSQNGISPELYFAENNDVLSQELLSHVCFRNSFSLTLLATSSSLDVVRSDICISCFFGRDCFRIGSVMFVLGVVPKIKPPVKWAPCACCAMIRITLETNAKRLT